jgi:threonine aldolase
MLLNILFFHGCVIAPERQIKNTLYHDDRNVAALAEALMECSLTAKVNYGGTDLVIFTLKPVMTAPEFLEKIRDKGILALKTGDRSIRIITHLDVSDAQIKEACEILASL